MNKVIFDTNGRKEYLTGFHDRKLERRARAKVLTEEKQKRFLKEKKALSKPLQEEHSVNEPTAPIVIEPLQDISTIKNYKGKSNHNVNVTVKVEPFTLENDSIVLDLPSKEEKKPEMTQREKVEILIKKELRKKPVTVKRMLPRNTKAKKRRTILHERIKKQKKMKKKK